jgi:hypothetical protein
MGKLIAQKSPVAVVSTKHVIHSCAGKMLIMSDARDHTYVLNLAILMIGFKKAWNTRHLGTCKLPSVVTVDELINRSMLQSQVS